MSRGANTVLTLTRGSDSRTAFAVNSAPLAEQMIRRAPRNEYLLQATHNVLPVEHFLEIDREALPRVRVHQRQDPPCVRSKTKS